MPTLNLLSFNIYGSGDNVHITNQGNDVYVAVDATGTTSIDTGDFTGAFYPRYANPKGYITQLWLSGFANSGSLLTTSGYLQSQIDNIQITGGTIDSGILASLFYPLNENPAGYITGINTSSFVNKSETGNFVLNNQIVNLVSKSETGNFVVNSQLSNLVNKSETGNFVISSQLNNLVNKSETGNFVINSQLNNLVNKSETGSFITNSQLVNYVQSSQTGIFATTSQLSSYVLSSQTGILATKLYVDNAVLAISGQGGGSGTIVKITGSANQSNINVNGIGSVKVVLSGNNLIISGNPSGTIPPGNFAQVTSGSVTMQGGATISNGELLIGDASDNSFKQGRINAGSGISITSGAGSLTISCTVAPTQQVVQSNGLLPIRTLGSNYTVITGDLAINPMTFVYTGNASGTITLPAANLTSGKVIICKQGGLGNLTVSANSIYFTGNTSSLIISGGDTLAFHSNYTRYWAH